MSRASKHEVIQKIRKACKDASFPDMPTACLFEMREHTLYQFYDRWLSIVIGKYMSKNM